MPVGLQRSPDDALIRSAKHIRPAASRPASAQIDCLARPCLTRPSHIGRAEILILALRHSLGGSSQVLDAKGSLTLCCCRLAGAGGRTLPQEALDSMSFHLNMILTILRAFVGKGLYRATAGSRGCTLVRRLIACCSLSSLAILLHTPAKPLAYKHNRIIRCCDRRRVSVT